MKLTTIQQFPKIDLHRHLDGDVTAEDIFFLAKRDGIPLPVGAAKELKKYFKQLHRRGLVELFKKGFGLVTQVMQTEKNLSYIAFREVEHLSKDGIIYAELRFAPQFHTGQNLSYQSIIRAVSKGLKQGEKKFKIKTKIIVCINRESEPEIGIKIAQAAIACANDGVVALDLVCDEANYPPERHLPAFQTTFNSPIKRTAHAGEFGNQPYKNIKTAIFKLKADRLGHCIPISQHKDLLAAAVKKKIGLELCPLSNMVCGFINSPNELKINDLVARGALVSINTDDPKMFNFTLSDTLAEVLKNSASPLDDLTKFQLNAIASSFLSNKEKNELKRLFIKKLKLFNQKNPLK